MWVFNLSQIGLLNLNTYAIHTSITFTFYIFVSLLFVERASQELLNLKFITDLINT